MGKNKFVSEYVLLENGTEVCSECGHIWKEEGAGHYQDCRYFSFDDTCEDEEAIGEIIFNEAQMSLFRPAA